MSDNNKGLSDEHKRKIDQILAKMSDTERYHFLLMFSQTGQGLTLGPLTRDETEIVAKIVESVKSKVNADLHTNVVFCGEGEGSRNNRPWSSIKLRSVPESSFYRGALGMFVEDTVCDIYFKAIKEALEAEGFYVNHLQNIDGPDFIKKFMQLAGSTIK